MAPQTRARLSRIKKLQAATRLPLRQVGYSLRQQELMSAIQGKTGLPDAMRMWCATLGVPPLTPVNNITPDALINAIMDRVEKPKHHPSAAPPTFLSTNSRLAEADFINFMSILCPDLTQTSTSTDIRQHPNHKALNKPNPSVAADNALKQAFATRTMNNSMSSDAPLSDAA
ncbi:hypothetical protein LZ30DRAFT_430435 [Colletotrichum cereale]|nr:hypothetical protein LZ30DRAFT_430435 [Colletotrichum cereale]